jgi:hypothetical protein
LLNLPNPLLHHLPNYSEAEELGDQIAHFGLHFQVVGVGPLLHQVVGPHLLAPTKQIFLENFKRECPRFRVWTIPISEPNTFCNLFKISDSDFENGPTQIPFIILLEQQFPNVKESRVEVLCKPVVQRWADKQKPTLSIERNIVPIYPLIMLAKRNMNITKRNGAFSDEAVSVLDMSKPNICSA